MYGTDYVLGNDLVAFSRSAIVVILCILMCHWTELGWNECQMKKTLVSNKGVDILSWN